MMSQTKLNAVFEDASILHVFEEGAEYEMDCGLFASQITDVSPESVTVWTVEKYGDGRTPYGNGGYDEHLEMFNHAQCAHEDGVVEYEVEGETRSLPKFLYFEETVEFTEKVCSIAELEDELSRVLDTDIEL